jgi:hypothetical protein
MSEENTQQDFTQQDLGWYRGNKWANYLGVLLTIPGFVVGASATLIATLSTQPLLYGNHDIKDKVGLAGIAIMVSSAVGLCKSISDIIYYNEKIRELEDMANSRR